MTELADFMSLFDGRRDVWGTNEGGSFKLEGTTTTWPEMMDGHLNGMSPGGVYPLLDDGTVKWGCIDFDEGDAESLIHARNVELCLSQFGIQGWVERSRSKGFHVWVYLWAWTDAELVRTALLAACQIVKAPTREINPKQTELAEGKIGNYVRLPYAAARTAGRQVMIDAEGQDIPLREFIDAVLMATPEDLAPLADLWEPPPFVPHAVPDWMNGSAPSGEAWDRLDQYTKKIVLGGPIDTDGDRSEWLFRLAAKLKEQQVSEAETVELVAIADGLHTQKFTDRADAQVRYEGLVQNAWKS